VNYELLLSECDKLTKENKPKEKPLTEEEKEKNYKELLLAQIKYERMNMGVNYGKENDDIFNFSRNKEKDFGIDLKKLNFDNEQKKIKNNNFLISSKPNKKVNKSSSVDPRNNGLPRGTSNTGNKLHNPYNIGNSNLHKNYRDYGYNTGFNYRDFNHY